MKKFFDYIMKHKYIILLILLYILFFFQMQFVHFYGDDFQVLYPLHSKHNLPNILDFCLDKMSYFWNSWSGRIVGHFIVSFGLSFFGIQFFRILNPIMIFIMAYLFLKILSLFKKFDFTKYLFLVSLIIIGMNVYISRETLYWAYGGILYIWGFNLTLLVIYIVYKYYLEDKQLSKPLLILLCIVCLLQTFILEQYSFMILAFLFILLIVNIKNRKNCYQIILLLLISIIGFITSSLAPGNILRTEPLVEELKLYTNFQIFIGKTHAFFNWIFNPKLLGVYISIFILFINKKYLSTLNKKTCFVKKLPSIITISYFFVISISKLFDINLLKFYDNSDSLYLMYHANYISATERFILYASLIAIILYYLILTINIFYIIFKIFWKEQKFLFLSSIITFITAIITAVIIRYIGIRYYMFFLISIILISMYCVLESENKIFTLSDLLFVGIILPFKYSISITVLVMIIILISKKSSDSIIKNSNLIGIALCIMIIMYNVFDTLCGYIRNNEIYLANEEVLSKSSYIDVFAVDEIPHRDRIYTWHSIVTRWNQKDKYYGFYLNDFYQDYYQINMQNVYIKQEDGYYVQ